MTREQFDAVLEALVACLVGMLLAELTFQLLDWYFGDDDDRGRGRRRRSPDPAGSGGGLKEPLPMVPVDPLDFSRPRCIQPAEAQ